jgi:hypothetical protein
MPIATVGKIAVVGLAGQHWPQRVNVRHHALRGDGPITIARRLRQHKVLLDERAQHKSRRAARGVVARLNRRRRLPGPGVDELFRIREDSRQLHVGEE